MEGLKDDIKKFFGVNIKVKNFGKEVVELLNIMMAEPFPKYHHVYFTCGNTFIRDDLKRLREETSKEENYFCGRDFFGLAKVTVHVFLENELNSILECF